MSSFTIQAFLHHLWAAKRWTAFHSPFLFRLFSYCCDDKNHKPEFDRIEEWRNELKSSRQKIERHDFGAGSVLSMNTQSVSAIAKQSLSLPFQCRFISRLVQHMKTNAALEFGTCLGISTAYMQVGNQEIQIVTVEGDPALAEIAKAGFEKLGMNNIEVLALTFEDFIEKNTSSNQKFDFIFLDGNHQSNALLSYYDQLRKMMHENTIVMIDDIYWSADMREGWNALIQKPEVMQSVDCFHFGLLFFRNDFLGKENHKVRLPIKSVFS